ncbi:methionyl-tRNA formyltransferase [Buchnera aphidicola]|uniref:methionyl-tRNA formyltransferase n=1 Tax=Buchnera aphidicola TaxID=9 RepID=UPI0031B832D4
MKKKKPLKIIFAGTPYFAACHLEKILKYHHVIAVLTQPDRCNKRGKKIKFSPVKEIAYKNNIPIIQLKKIKKKSDCIELLKIKADIMIVIAYGLILPKFLIKQFPLGCINVHPSLLPKWRGCSPIQHAILHGDKRTGVTIIQMNEKIDSGKIINIQSCIIKKQETTNSLIKKLCIIGKKITLKTLDEITKKKYQLKTQNEKQATYSQKLNKSMGKISFFLHAKNIERMIRAFNPWPGTYIQINDMQIKIHKANIITNNTKNKIGKIIKINKNGIQIQTKKNILNIQKIQIPGKKIITVEQLIQTNQKIFQKNQIIK